MNLKRISNAAVLTLEFADQYLLCCGYFSGAFLLSLIGIYTTLRFCVGRLGRFAGRRRPIIRQEEQGDGPWEVVTSVASVRSRGLYTGTVVMEEVQGLGASALVPSAR